MALVDLAKDTGQIKHDAAVPSPEQPIYPYGTQINLCNEELEKLGLDDSADVGDELHLNIVAKVVSVSKSDTTEGTRSNVSLQITHAEVTDFEEEPEEDPFRNPRLPYMNK